MELLFPSLTVKRISALAVRASQAHLELSALDRCRPWTALHPRRFHWEAVLSMLLGRAMLPRFRRWVVVAMIDACGLMSEHCSVPWWGRESAGRGMSIDRRRSIGLIGDCTWC